jgi:hypothetical protein
VGASKNLSRVDKWGIVPFALYLALSILVFGRTLLDDFGGRFIAGPQQHDPSLYTWCLVWLYTRGASCGGRMRSHRDSIHFFREWGGLPAGWIWHG